MVIIHLITYIAYLISVLIYYIFEDMYESNEWNLKTETEFYVARTFSFLLLMLVEAVLIYIFWGLSKTWVEFEENKSDEDGEHETVTYDNHSEV